jgi:ATP-dependent HslUV protease ATP-binding subunit HslU
MERLLDQIAFDGPDLGGQTIAIDAAMVRDRLAPILGDDDLSRFIL